MTTLKVFPLWTPLCDKWHEFSVLKSGPYVTFSSDLGTIFQTHKDLQTKEQILLLLNLTLQTGKNAYTNYLTF